MTDLPIIPYYRPRRIDLADFHRRVESIAAAAWYTNAGPQVRELEERIAELHRVRHCIAVCNATIGLQLVLQALEITGEVITTPFSFVATAHAVKWQGLTPVFCDIDPRTLTIAPAEVEKYVTPKTSAVLGVHVFGQPCDVEALERIGTRHGLAVVYDAAHCFMTARAGVPIGNFGRAEVLSFHATKVFQTFEGGAVLTNDDALDEKLRLLKNFGFRGLDWVDYLGINAKMNEVSAAYGLTLLPYMSGTAARLDEIHALYRLALRDVPGITIFEREAGVSGMHQYLPILIEPVGDGPGRDALWAWLWHRGIQSRRYFHPGLHRCQPYRAEYPWAASLLPVAQRVSAAVLCLPCYHDLRDDEVARVAAEVCYAARHGGEVAAFHADLRRGANTDPRLDDIRRALRRETDEERDA